MTLFDKNPLYIDYMGTSMWLGVYKSNGNLYSNVFWPLRPKRYMIRVTIKHDLIYTCCGPLIKSGKVRNWC